MAAVNLDELSRVRAIVIEQLHLVDNEQAYGHLSDASRHIDLAVKYLARAGEVILPGARRRINPSDQVLRKMLATGMDVWVADLLNWDRSEVRNARRRLGVESFGRGGSPIDRSAASRQWTQEWRSRLQQLGLWPGEGSK